LEQNSTAFFCCPKWHSYSLLIHLSHFFPSLYAVKVGKETILPPRLSCTLSEMVSKESRGEPAHKNKKRTKSPYNATKDPEQILAEQIKTQQRKKYSRKQPNPHT